VPTYDAQHHDGPLAFSESPWCDMVYLCCATLNEIVLVVPKPSQPIFKGKNCCAGRLKSEIEKKMLLTYVSKIRI